MRCLVVDDSKPFLDSATRLLESQGLEVVGCASSSDEALRLAAQLAPDVALVDAELGNEDGVDLARQLSQASPPTPVIVISAHESEDLPELIGDARMRFLPKTLLSSAAIVSALRSAGP